MAIAYLQLGQARENSTDAVSVYSPASGETAQLFLKICNVTASSINVRVFHDDNGTTYDESTALFWDLEIESGQILETEKIFMNDSTGNLAYRSSMANGLTCTVYGIVKS